MRSGYCLAILSAAMLHACAAITLVSVGIDGKPGDGLSRAPAVSADGTHVAFMSAATNLVADDTNGKTDIFLHDVKAGTTLRVSVNAQGVAADNDCDSPAISGDGRYVAFASPATNLVPGDTNKASDIFLADTRAGTLQRLSVSTAGTQGNQSSYAPAISGDGHFVAFCSLADNLAPGDTNAFSDIFVRDTVTGATTRVSLDAEGQQAEGPCNMTSAPDLVLASNAGTRFLPPAISADGRYVAFTCNAKLVPGDDNGLTQDIFVYDRRAGITACVSRSTKGPTGNAESACPVLSGDGKLVAFRSFANNLVPYDANNYADIFLRDWQHGVTTLVSSTADGTQANDLSQSPALSADGRFVAFCSHANNLVEGDKNGNPDIFLYDRQARTLTRVNRTDAGEETDDDSSAPALSADGHAIAFVSWSGVLLPKNGFSRGDVFLATF